jgi:hypothetical protein
VILKKASFGSESDDGINSDLDEDIDKGFRNNGSRSQGSPIRASVRHNALAYSDDEPFLMMWILVWLIGSSLGGLSLP